jgi:hypothetical protein
MLLDLLAAAWWPALLAATVAIGVTVAIERLGGKLGGLIGTLPTTIVPASLGLWTGDPAALADAMGAVPLGMFLNALFLWSWRVAPLRLPAAWSLGARLAAMSALSLGAWAIGATALTLIVGAWRGAGLASWIAGAVGLAAIVTVGLIATATPRPAPKGRHRVGPTTLLARGLLAGVAIGVAVVVSRTGNDVAAGVASVFPAIFLTTMVSLWLSQGEAVPAGAVGPMMLGSASVGTYALLASALYPPLGALPGTATAWGLAVVTTTVPAWLWLRRKDARAAALAARARTPVGPPGSREPRPDGSAAAGQADSSPPSTTNDVPLQ